MLELNKTYLGDCLEVMKNIPDNSVNLIVTDLPYGQLKSGSSDTDDMAWDVLIPFDKLWEQWERILTKNGTVAMTASGYFTGQCIMSSPKKEYYKYDLVWQKTRITGFLNGRDKHLRAHENVLIFSKGSTGHEGKTANRWCYNPQGLQKLTNPKFHTNKEGTKYITIKSGEGKQEYTNYPQSILKFQSEMDGWHPTQKPVKLFEYLVKTFSNEGDTVLDPTSGSGTLGIAALNTNRNFILIEKTEEYYNKILERIKEHTHNVKVDWVE